MIAETALAISIQYDYTIKKAEIYSLVENQSLSKKFEIRWWEDPNYVAPEPSDYNEDCFETNLRKLLESVQPNPWQNLDIK